MRIEGASGVFAAVNELRLNTSLSRIEVTLPGTAGGVDTISGAFRVVGVRIDANGKTGSQSVTASLNNAANNYILTTTNVTVISSVGPGISSFAIGARSGQSDQGTARIRTDGSVPDATGSFILTEGFVSAFRTSLQSSNSGTSVANGTQIRLTFNGVSAGVALNLATNTAQGVTAALSNTTITAAANTTTVSFAATNLTLVDTLEVDYTVVANPGVSVGTPGVITATATFFPIGAGVDDLGLPREDQGYPSFAEADFGPITTVQIEPALMAPDCPVLVLDGGGSATASQTVFPNTTSLVSFTAEAWIYPTMLSNIPRFILTDDAFTSPSFSMPEQ